MLIALFAIPLDALGKVTPSGAVTVAKVIVLFTLAAWFIRALLSKDEKMFSLVLKSPVMILTIFYLVFSFTSIVNAAVRGLWIGLLSRRINRFFLMVLIINLLSEKAVFRKAVYILFLANLLITASAGLFELSTGTPVLRLVGQEIDPRVIETGEMRIIGTASNPDFHAAFMILPTGIALALAYLAKKKSHKMFYIFAVLIFLVNIYGTGSRGGLIGFLLACLVFYLLAELRHKWVYGVGAVCGILLTALVSSVLLPSTPFSRYTGETGTKTITYRVGWMQMSFNMIKDHPILGNGTGGFLPYYNRYLVSSVPRRAELPENSFLQSWLENGIFSLLSYLGLYIFSAFNFFSIMRRTSDPYMKTIAIGFLSVIAGLGFFAMTANVLEIETYWMVFAFSVVFYNLHMQDERRLTYEV
jgi:O-antigen ligase